MKEFVTLLIVLMALGVLVGCGASTYWNEGTQRCHDSNTDQFVPSERCGR